MLKIICVLKSGGWCGKEDVLNLKRQIERNVSSDYEFLCYSDIEEIADKKLERNFSGWWSKLEIFNEKGSCIFFDLDVSFFGSIDPVLKWLKDGSRKVAFLEEWKPDLRKITWNSSIIAWNGDYSYLLDMFNKDVDMRCYKSDQYYMSDFLRKEGDDVFLINDICNGIYSYKDHCRNGSIPSNARIVCFYANPRPKQVGMPFWGYHLID